MEVTVRILGPVSLERAGEKPTLVAPTLGVLLAVLAAQRSSVVSTGRLQEVLWGDDPPASATATLQSHVSRLRRLLSPDGLILSRDRGYYLEMRSGVVDAEEFVRSTQAAREIADPMEAAGAYAAALAWWRGPPFGDLAAHDGLRAEAVRLDELRLTVTEEWVECRLAAGGDAALVGDLEGLTALHPLRERFWRQLMVALYRNGRQADALRRAGELRSHLRDELGLNVSAALRELEQQVLTDHPGLLAAGRPSPVARRGPVADDPSPLVGRDEDLRAIARAMRAGRVVTIVGPGGVGKTRVAKRLAVTNVDDFDDGAAVVELAAVREPAALAAAVATALDVQQQHDLSVDDTLLAVLASRRQLLVLDNCEHLLDAVVLLVERIRIRCHGVQVLATSREPLGLPGEVVWQIAPLELAPLEVTDLDEVAGAPAVQLLVERAMAARPGFALTADNAVAVAELCRRLDGLPLALELAAARLRSLSPETIVERLGSHSRLLDAGRRIADSRHRSLHDTITWSYDLLTPDEQTIFAQLSVFAGGFELEAVEAVCGPLQLDEAHPDHASVLDVLVALVDKSMVQRIDGRRGAISAAGNPSGVRARAPRGPWRR